MISKPIMKSLEAGDIIGKYGDPDTLWMVMRVEPELRAVWIAPFEGSGDWRMEAEIVTWCAHEDMYLASRWPHSAAISDA